MKLLVTGGAGYIGSHFTKAALGCGHSVSMIDDLSTGSLDAVEVLQRL
ncbi:MAG: NAD-dependent epimerase/dehydratase family protein, partial [Bacillota bacterium]|nr:NAD-dependent epimerase/dehydratase family protein [Bacillota bacterium]